VKSYFKGKTAWITGASSGLGEALAGHLASFGCVLILSARRIELLESLKIKCIEAGAPAVHLIPFDLGVSTEVEAALKMHSDMGLHTDFLFCNGGISQRALVRQARIADDYRIMETNYFAHVRIAKYLLPQMLQSGFGHFVITSSITGRFGFPLRSAYAASKHALHGFFESLQIEQEGTPIYTTIACPGRVNTAISVSAITADGSAHNRMDAGQKGGISADECAFKMLKAAASHKKQVWIGGREILMVWMRLYLPFLFFKLASKIKPT
jgi:short-subunit dehydrogenase